MTPLERHTRLLARVAESERKLASLFRQGVVHQVDARRRRVRLKLGEGSKGRPFLSPWVPYSQIAGAMKVHSPPSVGQPMTLLCPNGDFNQALSIPSTWSNANPSPSDKGDHHVMTFGPFTVTISPTAIIIEGGSMKAQFTPSEIFLKGGDAIVRLKADRVWAISESLQHNNKEVGDTHGHISAPPGGPGPPV